MIHLLSWIIYIVVGYYNPDALERWHRFTCKVGLFFFLAFFGGLSFVAMFRVQPTISLPRNDTLSFIILSNMAFQAGYYLGQTGLLQAPNPPVGVFDAACSLPPFHIKPEADFRF